MDIFDLSAKITLDSSRFESGLQDAGEKVSGFGTTLKNGLKKAAKISAAFVGIAGAGVSAILKESFGAYANFEQLVGGVETLFKGSADTVQEYAANAYKTAGLSANEYMETVTSFSASLLQSLGGDTEKAAKVGDMAISDMSDNANKMGSSMESIQNAYQGFAKQNYTMLDNLKLGYGGTKTEMERLLADAEKISGVEYDISSLSDVYEAIHVIQTELDITGTTAKEAQSTIQGSFSMMKSAWTNLLTGLADPDADLSELIGNLVDSAKSVLSNVFPTVKQIFSGIVEAVGEIVPVIADEIPGILQEAIPAISTVIESLLDSFLDAIPSLVGIAHELIEKFIQTVVKLAPKILKSGASIIKTLLNGLKKSLPGFLSSVAKIIPEVVKIITRELPSINAVGMEVLQVLVDSIPEISSALFEAIQSMVDMIVDTLSDGETLQKMIDTGVTLFTSLIDNVSAIIQQIVEALPGLIDAICVALTSGGLLEKIIAAGVALFTALVENISGIVQAISEALPMIVDSIVTALTTGNLIEQIIDAGVTMFIALVENLSAIIEGIAEALPKIVDSVVTALTKGDLLMKIVNAGVTMFVALIENIDDIILGITQSLPTLISKLVEALTSPEFLTKMSEAGIALLSGLVANIPGILAAMVSGLVQLAKGIANSLKKTLDNLWDWVFGGSVSYAEDLESGLKTTHNTYGHTYGGHGGKFASGTSHAPRGVSLVGEYGPELVFLNGGEEIWSASKTKKALNMSRKSGNVSVSEKTDSRIVELLEAILKKNTTIRLDDGTVIGWMDRQLGRRAVQKARGN